MLTELIVVQGSEAYIVLQLHFASSGFIAPPRFQTDPNLGGTEKLLVGLPPDGMMTKRTSLTAADVSSCAQQNLVNPGGLMFVKGWTRSFAAMCVMLACYENSDLYQARIFPC